MQTARADTHLDAATLRRAFAIACLVATLLALLGASQSQAWYVLHPGSAPPWSQSLLWSAAQWYAWALFVPSVAWLAARYGLTERRTRARRIGLHVAFAIGFAFAHLVLQTALVLLLPGGRAFFGTFGVGVATLMVTTLQWELLSYAAVLAAVHSLLHLRRAQAEALARRALQTEAVRAQLSALKRQMQPHFLFNALNALVAMQREDSAEQRYTVRLADLLRLLLDGGDRSNVSLDEELRLVETYLDIERARLGARLRVRIDVPGELRAVAVPAFILQPLVENAVTHGVAASVQGGEIRVVAARSADALTIEVIDALRGAAGAPRGGNGVALDNARRRLALLFGADAALEAAPTRDGFRAALRLPLPRTRQAA